MSCASARACTAVGYYENGDDEFFTFAEIWSGSRWKVQAVPTPTGAEDPCPRSVVCADLDAVSCISPTECTAVGDYVDSAGGEMTLAKVWNGTTWTVQTTPTPSGSTDSALTGVSCTSSTMCTAVGDSENSDENNVTLAEVWNGTTWSIQSTPNPSGAAAMCLTTLDCTAFTGVSCTSSTACIAVGFYANSNNFYFTVAEIWNGVSWAIQSSANPTGAPISSLDAVSCTSPTACTAVGYSETSDENIVTLAEKWNGTAWALESTPNPTGMYPALASVSCTSVTACTAVGTYDANRSSDYHTLAERHS